MSGNCQGIVREGRHGNDFSKQIVFKTVREYEISEANFFTSIIILHFWKLSDPNTVHAGGE